MIKIDIKKELFGLHGAMNLEVKTKINQGDFIALSGQSGGGKTTFLRIISGLETANGFIEVGGEVWQDEKLFLPPQKRGIGFVFQDYALFPNMNVKQNLMYVKNDIKFCEKLLKMSGLNELQNRLPHTLSGGQKQRVSLCRAMMNKPKLLLLDEPLSALDPTLREKLQKEITLFHEEFNTTVLMVSHDTSEIYKLSNRVMVLDLGKVIKDGSPKEVLMQTSGSQKFSFEGKLLDIIKIDVIFVAIVAIGQQLVEIVLSEEEKESLRIGQMVRVSTKAFSPNIAH